MVGSSGEMGDYKNFFHVCEVQTGKSVLQDSRSASLGKPSDAERLSRGADYSLCIKPLSIDMP